jgi:hypothetical protein
MRHRNKALHKIRELAKVALLIPAGKVWTIRHCSLHLEERMPCRVPKVNQGVTSVEELFAQYVEAK